MSPKKKAPRRGLRLIFLSAAYQLIGFAPGPLEDWRLRTACHLLAGCAAALYVASWATPRGASEVRWRVALPHFLKTYRLEAGFGVFLALFGLVAVALLPNGWTAGLLAFGLVFVLAPAWVVYHRDGLGREEARRDESEPGAHELEAAE